MSTYSLTLRELVGPSGSTTKGAKLSISEVDSNFIYLQNLASGLTAGGSGQQGPQGSNGSNGVQGSDGTNGLQGSNGVQGSAGGGGATAGGSQGYIQYNSFGGFGGDSSLTFDGANLVLANVLPWNSIFRILRKDFQLKMPLFQFFKCREMVITLILKRHYMIQIMWFLLKLIIEF